MPTPNGSRPPIEEPGDGGALRQGPFRQRLTSFLTAAGSLWARATTAGTRHYPPDVRRRLKILNVIAYLVAASALMFALQRLLLDPLVYAPVIAINLSVVTLALLVPAAHRISDIAGGLLLMTGTYAGVFGFVAFFGREGGSQLQYFIGAAAPFVVLGLHRLRFVLAVVLLGFVLHLAAWFSFPPEAAAFSPHRNILNSNYTMAAVTTMGLIAASVYYAFRLAENARAETEALLHNILPTSVVERLKEQPGAAIADSFDDATVLFADISGFVPLARRLGPQRTVDLLNNIVSEFDALAARHGVEKIKTIGDAYMAVAGVPEPTADHARRLAAMASDMLAVIERLREWHNIEIAIRVGLASGPVMAGVIGTRKFTYDVWGDAVNLAARLESLGVPGRIHICPACRERLANSFSYESRGLIDIKGVGRQETWLISGPARPERAAFSS